MPLKQNLEHRITPKMLSRARTLRSPMTPPEQKLWTRLQNRQLGGFKFRRQCPIGKYVMDFYCSECRLVVEIDGNSHGEQIEYDEKRTGELKEVGYEVIRFTNRQVMNELENVLEVILNECLQLQKRHSPSL